MGSWTRMQRMVSLTVGAVGGAAGFWYASRQWNQRQVHASWTTNFEVSKCGKWDYNWDHRDPRSLVEPVGDNVDPVVQNRYNEKLDKKRTRVTRHLILVRHGQYNMDGRTDAERYLTEKGRKQAACSGERLKQLGFDFDKIIRSTMTRAQETAKIISGSLPELKLHDDAMLEEGAPIPPEPPVGHWRPEVSQFFEDGARIEAAFRKYFHRAEPDQKQDTYTLVVCHANVIRYFVCRALQFPPEAWLRISLGHASITWISVMDDGRVTLRTLGETGHMPKELLSRPSNQTKARGTRNLILIRHGQYNLDGRNDSERYLTEVGQKQVAFTADYLKRLGVKFDRIVRSTMTRARESAKIISGSFPGLKLLDEPLLMEGTPIRPDPPSSSRHSDSEIATTHARIEAAFRKYFHRAVQKQGDTYTPVVCHANVIRYLVCRALQIPPEAWLRMSLQHASLTWIAIGHTGRVSLRSLGEASHIPPQLQSR